MKLVIFDCDGTLVDSQHMICAAMHKTYVEHSLPVPPRERLLSIVGLSLEQAFERLAEGVSHPFESLIAGYKSAFAGLRQAGKHTESLYPGAREALDALAARDDIVLGIATGKSMRGVTLVLGHHGLFERFATVHTSDDAPSKPHPQMLLDAMSAMGAQTCDTVMIGDTVFDIEMARAAGVASVGVAWGYHAASDLRAAGADVVIDDFAGLMSALEDIWRGPTSMRDIFEDIFINQPGDPTESARRNMRPQLRKRFYGNAAVSDGKDEDVGFTVTLDGKNVRTPARHLFATPTRTLAEALADEWNAQEEVIDPARMPLTRLANVIIDSVTFAPTPVAGEIEQYLASDLIFYRAGEPQSLVDWQATHWDPLLKFAREKWGARFILAEGIVHVRQPPSAIAAAASAIPKDPWRLGAVSSMTGLTGSALIALAVAHGALSADTAWRAAHADEDWQMQQWGADAQAALRRGARWTEMQAAATVLELISRR